MRLKRGRIELHVEMSEVPVDGAEEAWLQLVRSCSPFSMFWCLYFKESMNEDKSSSKGDSKRDSRE